MTEKKKEDSSKGSQTSWRNIHIKHTGKKSMKGGEKVFVSWEEGKDPDNVFSFDVVRYVM